MEPGTQKSPQMIMAGFLTSLFQGLKAKSHITWKCYSPSVYRNKTWGQVMQSQLASLEV